jgi:5-methylcytosine-specific restriction endonuclease McrA
MPHPPDACRYCGSSDISSIVLEPPSKHHGEYRCNDCGKHLGWMPKPAELKEPGKRSKNYKLAKYSGIKYCQLCLTDESAIPDGWPLEAHHVVPRSAGGTDEPSNLWILCCNCHQRVHTERDCARRLRPTAIHGFAEVYLHDLIRHAL